MTIPKKSKGLHLQKNAKSSTPSKPLLKKSGPTKKESNSFKNWPSNIRIEFEDEFLNNSIRVNTILE